MEKLPPNGSVFRITILHTNDFHGADLELLAKRATVIKQCRAKTKNPVLVLDAGDVFARGPYAKRFFGELEFEVMNYLEYDALTLGNNEFKATNDFSAQQILSERIRQARFPVLGANVVSAKTNQYFTGVSPYITKEFSGVKIAIFGVTAPRAGAYSQLAGFKVLNPIETSKRLVHRLLSSENPDIIVALTHIGIDDDLVLAEKVPDIQVIIGGDSHTTMMNPEWVEQCPIVQAGANGHYMGKMDLSFIKEDKGWRLKKTEWGLLNLYNQNIKPDPHVLKIIEQYLARPLKKAA
jgi:2',3'-cyclic-nucleotide 2'-phosphodiesterase (5'-nucleotidase family)